MFVVFYIGLRIPSVIFYYLLYLEFWPVFVGILGIKMETKKQTEPVLLGGGGELVKHHTTKYHNSYNTMLFVT